MNPGDIHLKNSRIPVEHTLRVASLNLLNRHENLPARLANLASEVERLELDVLALQEVLHTSDIDIVDTLIRTARLKHAAIATPKIKSNGDRYGNIILSAIPFDVTGEEAYEGMNVRSSGSVSIVPAAHARLSLNGREVTLFDVHLAWGSPNEPIRLRQATIIDERATGIRKDNPEAIVLMLGDFNAPDESSTMRYLYGLQGNEQGLGTLWIDAWEMFGSQTNYITSDPETYWGGVTGANKSGLYNLDLIPKRRIDHILSYEWSYGKHGSPLSFERFADKASNGPDEISDHFGIMADIYVPPLND